MKYAFQYIQSLTLKQLFLFRILFFFKISHLLWKYALVLWSFEAKKEFLVKLDISRLF